MFMSWQWSLQWRDSSWSLFISRCTSSKGSKWQRLLSPCWLKGKFDKRIKKSHYFCSLFEQFRWTSGSKFMKPFLFKSTHCLDVPGDWGTLWLKVIKALKRNSSKEELFSESVVVFLVCLFVFKPAPSEPALLKTVSIFNVLFTLRSSGGCFSALPVSSLCLQHNPIK